MWIPVIISYVIGYIRLRYNNLIHKIITTLLIVITVWIKIMICKTKNGKFFLYPPPISIYLCF